MGEPGRHLPQRRELLGAEHLAAALLEPLDHGRDLVGHRLDHRPQVVDVRGRRMIGPTTSLSFPAASWMGTLSWAIDRPIPRAIP